MFPTFSEMKPTVNNCYIKETNLESSLAHATATLIGEQFSAQASCFLCKSKWQQFLPT